MSVRQYSLHGARPIPDVIVRFMLARLGEVDPQELEAHRQRELAKHPPGLLYRFLERRNWLKGDGFTLTMCLFGLAIVFLFVGLSLLLPQSSAGMAAPTTMNAIGGGLSLLIGLLLGGVLTYSQTHGLRGPAVWRTYSRTEYKGEIPRFVQERMEALAAFGGTNDGIRFEFESLEQGRVKLDPIAYICYYPPVVGPVVRRAFAVWDEKGEEVPLKMILH